jgi:magnesium-transporting ATPase (P-type)
MSAPDPYAVGEEKTDMRISRDEFSWFKRIHSGLALFFTGFAVFLFCFPYLSNNADVFKITLEWPLVLTRDVKELGSFRFTRFLAPFTVITATAHAIHAFYYLRSDKNELSPLWWRWAEYSFSASWMLVCIATISGVLVCVVCSVGICWWKRIRSTVRSRYCY